MTEAEVWRAIIGTLRTGLDAQGQSALAIKQSFQPTKQGADNQDTVYLFRIASRRYGAQGKKQAFNAGRDDFDITDSYWLEATYQITALIDRDISDSSSLTSFDVADLCAGILQTSASRKKLLDSGIGILRITDIRNPFVINDRDQYQQESSFDFVLTYNQTIVSTVPKAEPVEADIKRI